MLATSKVYDLVKLALRECGVVSLGDNINPAVAQEALFILNTIRAEWSLNTRNNVNFDATFTAPENRTHITLGLTGDIPLRPAKITQVVVISSPGDGAGVNIRVPIEPYENYRALTIQNVFAIPNKCYIDTNAPLQNIWFYPGLSTGWTVRVEGNKYMTEYENLSDTFMDPLEYYSALYLTLALKLAPKYGVDLGEGTIKAANSAIKGIEANNFHARMKPMSNLISGQSGSGINFWSGLP